MTDEEALRWHERRRSARGYWQPTPRRNRQGALPLMASLLTSTLGEIRHFCEVHLLWLMQPSANL
jgi:hypothetical protein